MGITKIKGLLTVGVAALLLVGCTNSDTENDNAATSAESEVPTRAEEVVEKVKEVVSQKPPSINNRGQVTAYVLGDAEGQLLQGVFHFDFDQAIVKRNGHVELDRHADLMKSNRGLRVRLEGHADERGTREYNLALGERRANAIRSYLVNQGVSSRQLETISYGEEKPVARGNSESAQAQNRRVVFSYSN